MSKKMMLACVLTVICSTATAAESKPKGAYIGGGLGISIFDDGGAFAGAIVDDEDTSFQIHGGYKFLKHFAVEARYLNLGTFSVSGLDIDVSSISVHGVGIIPFAESGWELFGQLGIGIVNFDLSGFGDEDEDVFAGGIGIRYSTSQNFSMALQTDVYVWEDASLGPTYDLSVGSTQLTFQYIF